MTIAQGELVFVPDIGFRPAGTRTLRERVETTADGTRLAVLAVAAGPDRTDVVVEWQRSGDPAECPPGSTVLGYANSAPLENGITAAIVAGASRSEAIAMRRRGFQASYTSITAIDLITFPSVSRERDAFELRLAEGPRTWHLTIPLANAEVGASALTSEVERAGVVVRATAVTRHAGQVIVEMEVEGPHQIRRVAMPMPAPARFSDTSEADQRARTAEMRKHFGASSQPIVLESAGGERVEETARLFDQGPQEVGAGRWLTRFTVMFPGDASRDATLAVPYVELNDRRASATVDLRDVPVEVTLGEHRFRIVSAQSTAEGQRRVTMERRTSDASPRFMQPARVYGTDSDKFAWLPDDGPDSTFAMTTTVGDPPIVTFRGVVLRVDGPLRVAIPSLP